MYQLLVEAKVNFNFSNVTREIGNVREITPSSKLSKSKFLNAHRCLVKTVVFKPSGSVFLRSSGTCFKNLVELAINSLSLCANFKLKQLWMRLNQLTYRLQIYDCRGFVNFQILSKLTNKVSSLNTNPFKLFT